MNLNSLKPSSVTNKLNINSKTIIHFIPEFGTSILHHIKSLGLNLNNSIGIVIPTETLKFGGRNFDSKEYFDSVNKFIKNIRIMKSIPPKIPDNKFIIIDHSIPSKAIEHIKNQINEKQALHLLFNHLKFEFQDIKRKMPDAQNNVLISLSQAENGILDVLNQAQVISKLDLNTQFNVFDNFILASINAGEGKATIIPLMGYTEKGDVQVFKTGIAKAKSALFALGPVEINIDLDANDKEKLSPELTKLVNQVTTSAVKETTKKEGQQFKTSVEVNQKELTKILKKYKVKDQNIINNIKVLVDNYINKYQEMKKDLKQEELEYVVLQSINYSIFGTYEVKEEFLDNPNKLIRKLEEVNNFSIPLSYPPSRTAQAVTASDMIGLTESTGPSRHEFEFGQNIHDTTKQLFKSLENKKQSPIKILGIKYEIKDDNLNRTVEYTIKMQNLAGGKKEPYEIKMNMPSLINGKYFKLNGRSYIMSSQQFLNPVTKPKTNEVRLLSHFSTLTLKVINLKHNSSEIQDVLKFITRRYSQLVSSVEYNNKNNNIESITFTDGTLINPYNSNTPYVSGDKKVYYDNGKFIMQHGDEVANLSIGKNEYIYDKLLDIIHRENPSENLTKTARSIPYIELHIQSRRLPLIVYFWQQLGLSAALVKFGIDYEVAEEESKAGSFTGLTFSDSGSEQPKKLFCYPANKRQELIVNGLLKLPKNFQISTKDLGKREIIFEYINERFGTRTVEGLDNNADKWVDPTTEALLNFNEFPTNVNDLISDIGLEKVMNDDPDHPADLSTMRVRQAEVMSHLLYSQLQQAHNKYRKDVEYGFDEAGIWFDSNYVVNNLIGKHAHSQSQGEEGGLTK